MLLYHGSTQIIKHPIYHGGKRNNDYGYGFYTTENIELAKEWACSDNTDGIVNIYELDLTGLSVLNLNSSDYCILNWLALLTRYRSYWQNNSISEVAKKYLQDHFFIDPEEYDIVIGYRADDSYFSFAQDFISNTISYRKLSEAMHLGKLGEQIVLKSERAHNKIKYIDSVTALSTEYYIKKRQRDLAARKEYRDHKASTDLTSDIFMLDIMREEMNQDDPRLR